MSSLTKIKNNIALDKLSGVITWLVVASMSIYVMLSNELAPWQIALALCLYLAYIVLWLVSIRETDFKHDSATRFSLLGLLILLVIGIFFVVPLSFNSILMGILCGAFPHYMSIKRALIVGSILSLPLYFIYGFYWNNDFMFLTASLFWTFNMFAIVMVNTSVSEKAAREKAEEMNRQLVSTQALLHEASKQSERVRIARNIHDLLGHHLTALTINLQVAGHKTSGEVKQNIDQCHQLAKLLLSDVRDAVSDIRDKSKVDLRKAIESIAAQVPSLNIEINISDELEVDDIEVADTLVKCIQETITNTIKHARGTRVTISLKQDRDTLQLKIENNGKIPNELQFGNGLNGMQERVALLKGKIDFILENGLMNTYVNIPTSQRNMP